MPRTATVREQVKQFVHATPFQPFVMIMENGQKLLVEHPECVAFDPAVQEGARGWDKLAVVSEGLVVFCTLGAVTTINTLDRGQVVG